MPKAQTQETITVDPGNSETITVKTEAQIREEILAELKQSGKLVEEQPKNIINEIESSLEKPRRVIFEIKGVVDDDAMLDGSYIAGKSVGIAGYKLVSSLVNRNMSIPNNPSEDNFVTGFEVEDIVQSDLPEDIKKQRIKDINIARKWLESKYGSSLDRKNSKFWADYTIKVDDLGKVYDTNRKGTAKQDDPILLYYTILGGGHPDVALSYEDARAFNKFYYLTIRDDESNRQFSTNMDKINANAALKDVMDNWSKEEILALCYYQVKSAYGFVFNTPRATLVQELLDFVDGVNFKKDKKKKPGLFLNAYELFKKDRDKFMIEAIFNAALHFGIVLETGDKELINKETNFRYGSTIKGALDKLLSPKNIEELSNVKRRVLDKWNT